MEMIDMKKEQEMPESIDPCDYPYGLSLSIDAETFSKLKLSQDLKIGDLFKLEAIASVKSLYKEEEGLCVGLQITEMGLQPEGAEKSAESMLYGDA